MTISKMPSLIILAILAGIAGLSLNPHASQANELASPYTFDSNEEAVMLSSALAAAGYGQWQIIHKASPTEDELNALNRRDLNPLDRPWAGRHDPKSGRISDIFQATAIFINPLGGATLISPKHWRQITFLGIETAGFTLAGIQIAKGSVRRFRPRAYPGSDASLNSRLADDQTNSFFSGHVAAMSSSASFAAKIVQDLHPYLAPWVWGGAAGFATLGAVYRVRSGAHFPTDALAGMAWGGAVGYLIPSMHQTPGAKTTLHPWRRDDFFGFLIEHRF